MGAILFRLFPHYAVMIRGMILSSAQQPTGVKVIQRPSNNTWTIPAIWFQGAKQLRWHYEFAQFFQGGMWGDTASLWNMSGKFMMIHQF